MSRRVWLPLIALSIVTLAFIPPGCDTLVTEKIVTIEAGHPLADFRADRTIGCAPCTVNFTDSSRGPRQVWIWNFGDDSSLTFIGVPPDTVTHVYDTGGVFDVTLTILDTTVQDTGRDTEVKNNYITVGTTSAGFEIDSDTACAGRAVVIRPPEAGGIFQWQWDFGDDSSITYAGTMPDSITHVYDSVGSYWIRLIVSDTCGSRTDSNAVVVTDCPTVFFWADSTQGCQPFTVTFHDTSSLSGEGFVSRSWDFGNGDTSSLPDPEVTYPDPGVYTIGLQVTTTGGVAIDSTVDYITVFDSARALVSVFDGGATEDCYSVLQQFQVKFEADSLGTIDSLVWYFGDGTRSFDSDTTPLHAYVAPGRYTVILEAYGPCGFGADTAFDFVILSDKLTADSAGFTITPDSGNVSTEFIFADTSRGVITDWQWVFGDDDTLMADSGVVTHTYADTGTYEVKLTISNKCGTAVAMDSVKVTE